MNNKFKHLGCDQSTDMGAIGVAYKIILPFPPLHCSPPKTPTIKDGYQALQSDTLPLISSPTEISAQTFAERAMGHFMGPLPSHLQSKGRSHQTRG
jgi:hypothetical protein